MQLTVGHQVLCVLENIYDFFFLFLQNPANAKFPKKKFHIMVMVTM